MGTNEASLDDTLTQLRSSIAADIKQHVNALNESGVEFYGYALLPPDYYTAYEPVTIAVAYNREADIEVENRDDIYFRYSVNEWQNYVHDGFDSTNAVLRTLLSRVRDEDDNIDDSLVESVYGAMLDGLASLREDGVFSQLPYVVIWLSDSDDGIMNQSVKTLNSAEVYAEFATEFAD